jgi:tellurite resistance protein TehA-like permease
MILALPLAVMLVALCAAAGSYHRWPPAVAAFARWALGVLFSAVSAVLLVRLVGPAVLRP